MAVTRRGYIFSAFLLGVVSVLLVIVAVSSDSWIVSSATAEVQTADSTIRYGLFRGELVLNTFGSPVFNTLYMTCIPSMGACAVSCRTLPEIRQQEVEALANGYLPTPACSSSLEINTSVVRPNPAVISFALYVCTLLILFLQLLATVVAAGLAITNATHNPTEPMFSLPGCLWVNVVAAVLGVLSMMVFGIYWASSGLSEHLAFSYTVEFFTPTASLGYSYWMLIIAVLCSLSNVGLISLRRYLLERDPPPPVIKVDTQSDGTIFLY